MTRTAGGKWAAVAVFATCVLPAWSAPPRQRSMGVTAASGGATTVAATGRTAYALPLANIKPETRRAFSVGNSFFNENWVAAPASAARLRSPCRGRRRRCSAASRSSSTCAVRAR